MTPVTILLNAAAEGNRQAASDLLPLVYDELRRLAAYELATERPGHTLQPTALVHEAYLRLVGKEDCSRWNGREHFFLAAAGAMRRILVDSARARKRLRRGGDRNRVEFVEDLAEARRDEDLLGVDEVVDLLHAEDPQAARLVQLHVFAGTTIEQAGEILGISARTAYRDWAFARAWMFKHLEGKPRTDENEG